MKHEEEKPKDKEERQTARLDRGLNRIQLMKEGDDVEDYIRSLESLMRWKAVPDGKWKQQVLLSAITPRYKALIEEVTMDKDSTYQQVVNALLNCGGLNHMRAADLFLDEQELKLKGSSPAEMLHSIFRWLEKACQGAMTLREGITRNWP